MKKLLCILLAAALLCVCLPGCHGAKASQSFQIPESFDTSRNYEITFWAKSDTNKTQTDIYNKAIADFHALYPNISVKLRIYTDYGRIYNEVITNIATGTTPNVCITYPDHIATYLTGSNTVVPLDALFADPQYGLGGSGLRFDGITQEQIIPRFLEECVIGDKHYAMPYMRSSEVCYVNKTFVEKLGYTLPETLTWDFIWEVSRAATAKDEEGNYLVNGQKTLIPFMYKSTDNMMIQLLRQQGAGYSTDDGEILLFNDTAATVLETVAAHVELGAFSTFKISSYPANFLNAGQCIFAIDSTAGATWMGSDAPLVDISEEALVQFETAVMMLPQYNPAQPLMISQGPSVCVFNKTDPQEVLASWLFAQYLLTDSVQIAYAQTEGYVPVTSKAQQSNAYQDYLSRAGEDNNLYYRVKLEATQLLLDNMDNTFVTPVFNGSASVRNAAGQLIENTAKAVRSGQTVNNAYIRKLYDDTVALYRLDQLNTATVTGKTELGPMPAGSVALLAGLGMVWLLMGIFAVSSAQKKKKQKKVSKDH
jgi:multiple sugar transport system substrate-binding protein